MEYLIQPKDLFSRFSHCCNIMNFYGNYYDARKLLTLLCRGSYELWAGNSLAFSNLLNYDKKTMEYSKGFTEKFVDFILKENNYMNYKLKISLQNKRQIETFCDFIKTVKNPQCIEFAEIAVMVNQKNTNLDLLNSPYNTMVSLGLDYSQIQIYFEKDLEDEDKWKEGFEYTKEVKADWTMKINNFKEIGRLLFFTHYEMRIFVNYEDGNTEEEGFPYSCKVKELAISYDMLEFLLYNGVNLKAKIHKFLESLVVYNCQYYHREYVDYYTKALTAFPQVKNVKLETIGESGQYIAKSSTVLSLLRNIEAQGGGDLHLCPSNPNSSFLTIKDVNVYYCDVQTDFYMTFHVRELRFSPTALLSNYISIDEEDASFMSFLYFGDCDYIGITDINRIDEGKLKAYKKYIRHNLKYTKDEFKEKHFWSARGSLRNTPEHFCDLIEGDFSSLCTIDKKPFEKVETNFNLSEFEKFDSKEVIIHQSPEYKFNKRSEYNFTKALDKDTQKSLYEFTFSKLAKMDSLQSLTLECLSHIEGFISFVTECCSLPLKSLTLKLDSKVLTSFEKDEKQAVIDSVCGILTLQFFSLQILDKSLNYYVKCITPENDMGLRKLLEKAVMGKGRRGRTDIANSISIY